MPADGVDCVGEVNTANDQRNERDTTTASCCGNLSGNPQAPDAAGLLATVPIMTTLATTTSAYAAFGLLLLGMVLLCPYTAVSAIFKAELFPTEIRAMAVGISFATSVSIFGGTSELIALSFKKAGHESWFYWYMTASFALSLVTAIAMRRPADASIEPKQSEA
ncbi:MAG: hypothetical protein ACXWLX_01250 [Rhizomicrobium sp.]